MIINSTELNNSLNDSRIDVFFKHHPPGQGLHTVPVTVNLRRGAKKLALETGSELLFWHLYLGRAPTHNCECLICICMSISFKLLIERAGNVLRAVGSEEETCYQWIACAVEKKSQPCGETRSQDVLSSLTDKTFCLSLPHLNDKS